MDFIADGGEWARENFGGADLGDPRRTRRLITSAALIAAHPQKSFPQVFDWNQLRGFYCLCDSTGASTDSLHRPHRELTRQRMGGLPLVLIHHDTTTLDFSSHHALDGAGPIGDGNGRGFLQHNSLAFSPDGERLLGLIHQQFFVRSAAPPGESHAARKRREGRESLLWVKGIAAVGVPPEGSTWIDVGDRGADDYEAMTASLDAGHGFLFRICQDRKVFVTAEHGEEVYLMRYARALVSVGGDVVEIPGRGGRPPRTAEVAMAAAPVWVPPPCGTPKRQSRPVLAAWVIRVWEADAPAGVKEPLEWVLLCSVETTRLGQIKQRRDWYGCRWGVEVYHDVGKNGCSEEGRMFQTAERMEACLAILSVVAVRVYQLRLAVKTIPEAPAREVATAEEIEVISSTHKGKEELTVKDFVFAVAKLGGFLGRKGDGEPGVRSLWRGYQRLQDMVAGFRLHNHHPQNDSG
jgi:transposase-like protein/transposase Tn5 family protein